ncbi:MAG: thioredoxin domain-containing protein [Planctomycetes bacterium]|nr:thioredoxin domain-containing protein [Planctomycetota bacterium]
MTKSWALQITAIVLALVAAVICQHLLDRHITGKPGPAWFEAGCSAEPEAAGGPDCATVLASPWSYWPPPAEGDPPNKARIPVAFLGLIYYAVFAVWFVGIGRPARPRRWMLLLPAVLMLFGLAGSAFFTYIMFTRLDAWCPWCLVTHGLNVLLAACLVLMWRRKRDTAEITDDQPASDSESAPRPAESLHPTWRLCLITAVAAFFVFVGINRQYGRAQADKTRSRLESNFERCMSEIKKIQQDGQLLLTKFLSGEVRQIERRRDDPYRKLGRSRLEPLKVIVFSDFECPECRNLANFLESDAQKLFGGALAVIFKYYPLDKKCNDQSARSVHPNACAAARMAEAARQLEGNDAFWDVHDYLYENQQTLKQGKIDTALVAEVVGVDHHDFVEAMNSAEVDRRIKEDIAEARKVGVRSTPSAFIYGRKVGVLYMREINFWDKLADYYWQKRTEPRPEETKMKLPGVTPDTQGPTDAQ